MLVRVGILALTLLCQPISFVTNPCSFLCQRPPADMSVRERTLGREGVAHRKKHTECDLNAPTHFYLPLVKAVARAPEHDITCMTRSEVKGVGFDLRRFRVDPPAVRREARLYEPGVKPPGAPPAITGGVLPELTSE